MTLLPDSVGGRAERPNESPDVPPQGSCDDHRVPPQWNADCSLADCGEGPEHTGTMRPK
jgi:hypothetical protein